MPQSCADQGKDCGMIDDGCGTPIDCGGCFPNATCGADHVCGSCTKFTCAAKDYHCGMLDDGCGGVEFCGDYMRNAICDADHVPPNSGTCPASYGYGWLCQDGSGSGVLPPYDCIQNPMEPISGWCCKQSQ